MMIIDTFYSICKNKTGDFVYIFAYVVGGGGS